MKKFRYPCTGHVDHTGFAEFLERELGDSRANLDGFRRELGEVFGAEDLVLVNSGSSANLLALSCLTSPKLADRQLRPGDEVITCATGFPTTVNPIIQNGLVPVFVDVQVPTYNLDASKLEEARSERRQRFGADHQHAMTVEAVHAMVG